MDQQKEKLVIGYWDIRGLVAPIKYLLEHLGVEYEDRQHFYGEAPDHNKDAWFSVKYHIGLPFPNLPYLFDGDLKITESHAIMRYICNKYGADLLGKTVKERALVDMVINVAQDLRNSTYDHCYETGDKETLLRLGYEKIAPISKFHKNIIRSKNTNRIK